MNVLINRPLLARGAAAAALVLAALLMPGHAHAWGYYGHPYWHHYWGWHHAWGWRPYGWPRWGGAGPAWVPAHWSGPYWVPGHWG